MVTLALEPKIRGKLRCVGRAKEAGFNRAGSRQAWLGLAWPWVTDPTSSIHENLMFIDYDGGHVQIPASILFVIPTNKAYVFLSVYFKPCYNKQGCHQYLQLHCVA